MSRQFIDLVSVIRSKNAGPFEITLDIIFKDWDTYESFYKEQLLSKELIAKIYKISVDDIIELIYYHPAKAVKVTLLRQIPSGNPGDTDVYGAQQHAPLLGIEFE